MVAGDRERDAEPTVVHAASMETSPGWAGTAAGPALDVQVLQGAVGNRALASLIQGTSAGARTRRTVEREGPRPLARCRGPCTCGGRCGEADVLKPAVLEDQMGAQLKRAVLARRAALASCTQPLLQRDVEGAPNGGCDPSVSSCPPAPEKIKVGRSVDVAPVEVTMAQARDIVDDVTTAFRGIPGAVIVPFPEPLVASNDTVSDSGQSLMTWPTGRVLARDSSSGGAHFEGGFVASLQLCWDPCTHKCSVVGWFWIGAGVEFSLFGKVRSFAGGYYFKEGEWKFDAPSILPALDCGQCDPACRSGDGDAESGFGVVGFPVVLKPGALEKLKAWGIEVGFLWTPHGWCSHDVEFIVLADLTKLIPVVGPPMAAAFEAFKTTSKKFLKLEFECGVGIDGSLTVHFCRSAAGGVTVDSVKGCLGGYLGCNIGLPAAKEQLPGATAAASG